MQHSEENKPVVAFMLAHYPKPASLNTLMHLGLDRWSLICTPGLQFWRLLGVGRGHAFDPHADWQRYAMFTVWQSRVALRHFEEHSAIMRRIRRNSDELWTVHMLPVRWHGRWGGYDPFAHIPAAPAPDPGPWVILTRATIHLNKVAAFLKAVPAVAEHLLQQPERLNSVGIGEAPLIYQATLSVWRTLPAITSFAYSATPHAEVIRRTRRERWYKEELFARFRPIASSGTWEGRNPLDL